MRDMDLIGVVDRPHWRTKPCRASFQGRWIDLPRCRWSGKLARLIWASLLADHRGSLRKI